MATAIWSSCEGMLQLLHQELIAQCSSSEYPQCTLTATPSFCCYKKSKVNFQPVNTGWGAHLPLKANWARLIFLSRLRDSPERDYVITDSVRSM